MAYGVRYRFDFTTINGKEGLILISQDGYSGEISRRCLGGSPQLRLENSGIVMGMSLEIPAECVVEDEFAALYTPDPYKFLVTLAISGNEVWRGLVTPELYSSPWIDPPYDVAITATDGLGELKLHEFPALGEQSLEAVLSAILGVTGLSMPIRLISSMSNDTSIDEAMIDETIMDFDGMAGKTYYQVLESVLTSLNAIIMQREGAWLIIRETDISSRISGGAVTDLPGKSYEIVPFGSLSSNRIWPVGQLRSEIVPAKNRVAVKCDNDYRDSLLPDPDMTDGDWKGEGVHYDTDGGFYALTNGKIIYQDYTPPQVSPDQCPDMTVVIKARQSDNSGTAMMLMTVEATGISKVTGKEIAFRYRYFDANIPFIGPGEADRTKLIWDTETGAAIGVTIALPAASSGNSGDCAEYRIPVKYKELTANLLTRVTRLRLYINSLKTTTYIHHCSLASEVIYESVTTSIALDNGARGASPEISPLFADSWSGNRGSAFMRNVARGRHGLNKVWLIDKWRSANIPSLPYGEFLAKDKSLQVALPRLRLSGRLNLPESLSYPPLLLSTKGVVFLPEEWTLSVLEDEVDISMLMLPAVAIQVTSVRHIVKDQDGETVESSVSVLPASFHLAADDFVGRYYIAVTVPEGTSWIVTQVPEWLTFSSNGGTGSGTVSFMPTANSGEAREAVILVAGVPVSVVQDGYTTEFPLSINVYPSDATLYLAIGGVAVDYLPEMLVEAGSQVVVRVSKNGYLTENDSFVMPSASVDKEYTLAPDIPVTFTSPEYISYAAQRVPIKISDPSGKGWGIDFDNPNYLGYVTGAGVTSGSASVSGTEITGRGDAEIWLQVTANNGVGSRDIGSPSYPFYVKNSADGSWVVSGLLFSQLGTSSAIVPVTSVSLNRSTLSLNIGATNTLTATVTPSNATNKAVSWSSSDPSVATVNSSGVVTAVKAGTATIRATATDGTNKYGSCTVTVIAPTVSVTGVSLDKTAMEIGVGGTGTLTATVTPSNATNKAVSWSSSNPSVATVNSSGVVTGVNAGTTTIKVTTSDGGYIATCQVTVLATTIPVTGVLLDKSVMQVATGLTSRLAATVTPSNATNKGVTWRSSNSGIATVDSSGVVTGISQGSCVITARTDDGGYEASCTVSVVQPGSMSVEDTMVRSVATTASAELIAENMNAATITASCPASWVEEATIDASSSPYRVRLKISANSSSSARSATVTVTGKDLTGATITTTFLLTQSGQSSSDIPCTGMTMSGPDTIYNSDNIADYTVEFTPLSTTQNAVDWSVTTRSGGSTSLARISVTGDSRCTVEVLSGASSAQLTVRAVNRYNGQIVATKDITATYIGGSTAEGRIEVSESYIEVAASSTEDDWAQVTLVDMSTPLNQLGVAVSGFITSAAVDSRGRVRVVFPANTSSESRSGSVTLTGIDASGNSVMTVISYLQSGVETGRYTFEVAALEITGTTRARFAVVYRNDTRADATVTGLHWTLTGYDSIGGVTCRANGYLSDKTVAAVSEETDVYSAAIEVTGPTVRYVLTLTSDASAYTYEGDGSDPI